jgi:phosphoglycolate phosphatase-like HAD superfamily hydrolase
MTKKTYIYDVDGVVFDSNSNKIQAYRELLLPLGSLDKVKVLVDNFRLNFGRTRRWHMEFAADLLDNNTDVDVLINNYGKKVESMPHPLIKTNAGRIKELSGNNPFFVSGSNKSELDILLPEHFICDQRNIFGSPDKKSIILSRLKKLMVTDTLLYFGDSVADIEACDKADIECIALYGYSAHPEKLKELANKKGILCLKNLEFFNEY